jgi:hypothetical protein
VDSYSRVDFDREVEEHKQQALEYHSNWEIKEEIWKFLNEMYTGFTYVEWARQFLNNFYGNFPNGYRRRVLERLGPGVEGYFEEKSMMETLDQTLEELNIDTSTAAIIASENPKPNLDIVIEVYIKMRQCGFTHEILKG